MVSTAVLPPGILRPCCTWASIDFLPRESEIIHLKFWDLAFAQLKAKGVLYLETKGKTGLLGDAGGGGD